MEYIFETKQNGYEDFASGRVLYNARGTTAFPVRLASEIMQRCFRHLEGKGNDEPYAVYDPCCGGAYMLTVVGLLHGHRMKRVVASDVNPEVLGIAEKNLSLLSADGMSRRKKELAYLLGQYNKPSHREALESVEKLAPLLTRSNIEETCSFHHDVTATAAADLPVQAGGIDIVLTDLPYGEIVHWQSECGNPLSRFFDNMYARLEPERSVMAVIADKRQKLRHDKFRRLEAFKVGKRQVAIFEPISG
ncbi:hypothetical protein J6TS7_11870 [Paenibacillus dendritiformis]|uniref:hypothetical protein n=1 Tax=Paenibacillus TaxID=44249 RepID=UPI001B213F7D|nr:hypothetical protein [Paenibacillus dendritiformis]MEB9895236.1 hypothetical protein [Bacillus cereus]GIO77577.1 hypothetical protein J6TS7_11870 [Paenibacillus dendritiformis]